MAKYKIPGFFAQLEGVAGSSFGASSDGLTAVAGYMLLPKLQSVIRYEIYSPPAFVGADAAQAWSAGLNYLISGYRAKVQLAFTGLTNMSAASDSELLAAADLARLTGHRAQLARAALGIAGSGFEVALFDDEPLDRL